MTTTPVKRLILSHRSLLVSSPPRNRTITTSSILSSTPSSFSSHAGSALLSSTQRLILRSRRSSLNERNFTHSSIKKNSWLPSALQWNKSTDPQTTTTTTTERTGIETTSTAAPTTNQVSPTVGAQDFIQSPTSSSSSSSSSPAAATLSSSSEMTTPPMTESTSTETESVTNTINETIQTFHLAGKEHISSGTLDLTSLASAWGPHPIQRLQSMFLQLHDHFPLFAQNGLPWYVLIPTVTLALRLLLFYFQVRANANAARMAIIQPQMLEGMNKLKQAKARGDMTGAQAAQMETQALMRKHNVNPIKNLVFPLAQASVFMCMFFAIRGLTNAGLDSMMIEGFAWVPDLTKPDPYWILPIASTALTVTTLELGVDSTTQVQTSTTKNMKTAFRAILAISLPFIAYFPSAVLLYWTTNNFLSLLQSQALKLPRIRTFFNIPIPPKKPIEGEKGFIKEPSFSEAFKNMQLGMQEKWQETKETAEQNKQQKNLFEGKNSIKKAEIFIPKSINRVEQVAKGLTIDGAVQGMKGEIRAEQPSTRPVMNEKARRLQAARERRMKRN